ncbi:hypothetical protein H6P81_002998 [Aristolochia fimbriata]|uniref:ATP synthase protein I-related protein n=1 Tax=Aristolochia fimbriata TaxID=158543 RepID=A0AAV7FBC9_ARIFI|nr:hypothetical protein H6P81_002998 [Aristolochia fimbriata]
MDTLFSFRSLGMTITDLRNPCSTLVKISSLGNTRRFSGKCSRDSALRSSLSESDLAGEEILQIFLKERQLNGDIISKTSDILWTGNKGFISPETSSMDKNQGIEEVTEDESSGGYLKLTQAHKWISGDSIAPYNRKYDIKKWQNDSEKRKRLNLLKYDALKRELLLLTTGIGAACSGYCLLTLSVQASISYALGVVFSCIYLQLVYYHVDGISKEDIPLIFMQKKSKKIGIRSEDLKNFFEKIVRGSAFALSSPRLVIPAAIYGLWGLSHHFFSDLFDFQLVPAMFGLFAYKAAALVQVYRDNEDLRFIFPDGEGLE